MVIRSKTLRLVILISTVLVTIIVAVQMFWLQKVYRYEEKQFNINVSKSIRALYDDMELVNDVSDNAQKEVENPQPDLYILRIDCNPPSQDSLWLNLQAELTDFDVYTDCKAAIFNLEKNKFVVEKYIDLPDAYNVYNNSAPVPMLKKNYSYLAIFFPHRGQYILKQMYFWIASGGLLLLVLTAFGASIFYLYKQKFLNETQKDFVNNFTHEFKTPLAVIKIAAEVLQQPTISSKPDKLNNYATIINDQTGHLQNQIQRLLEITYTESSKLPLEKSNFDINVILQQAINDLHPLIEQTNAILKTTLSSTPINVFADKYYLQLTFINLIENAIKYSPNPVIFISTFLESNYCCIEIKDNGVGINEAYHKKIFNKFFRVTSGELHTAKGFGLGLSFVKNVIDTHGGKIEVKSEAEKGSTFIIKIPQH